MMTEPKGSEIGLEDLANVAGGNKSSPQLAGHCATGSHIKQVGVTLDSGITLNFGQIEVKYVEQK
jgi:type VI protein secretion system component Hcp